MKLKALQLTLAVILLLLLLCFAITVYPIQTLVIITIGALILGVWAIWLIACDFLESQETSK